MDGDWTVPGYRHVRTLGEGASGRVILAIHEETGTPTAIKYLSEQLRSDETFLQRFRAEAELMAQLDAPDIVRFYEYVEAPGAAALVMELVDGVTLKDIIKSEGATGPEAALLVLKGSLRGLAAAHAVGVVHRDYKPGNVLVSDDGSSKLADFGVAVRAGEQVTASGTPAYMAPEQWAVGAVGPATDVYAATAVFYECLTGERPYPVKGLWALAAAHRDDPIPADRVPPGLATLVVHGMAKNPADRPPSAAAFLAELEDVALAAYGPGWEERGRVRLAALAAMLAALFPMAGVRPTASTALALTRLGRRRLAMISGALVAAMVGGGGGAFVLADVHHRIGATSSATSRPAAAISPGTPTPPVESPPPSDSPTPTPDPETTPPTTDPTTPPPATSPAVPTPSVKVKVPKPPIKVPTTVSGFAITSSSLSFGNASVTVNFKISGSGKVTVSGTFTLPSPERAPALFAADSVTVTETVSGRGSHTVTLSHDFGEGCPAFVQIDATTSAGGSDSAAPKQSAEQCQRGTVT
jgi:eukaryotic-like serine/threonine-protein kinase